MSHKELEALEAMADSIGGYKQHLGMLTTEALAEIYESGMITKQTRKELGTHSTPPWLIDYIIARLAPWIENDIPAKRTACIRARLRLRRLSCSCATAVAHTSLTSRTSNARKAKRLSSKPSTCRRVRSQ